MEMFPLFKELYSNGIILVICDIRQLVNPPNTELNKTLITGVPATILMDVFITLNLYILVIENVRKNPPLILVVKLFKIF